jgi:hypothetical protein
MQLAYRKKPVLFFPPPLAEPGNLAYSPLVAVA